MSWFQSLTSALGSGSNTTTNSTSTGESNGNTFDASGNPATGGASIPSDSPNAPSGGVSKPSEQSLEELLFAPTENTSTKTPESPASPKSLAEHAAAGHNRDAEIAPGLTSKQLVEGLQSVNFMGAVSPEVVSAALGGDSAAFSKVISSVAQISAGIAVQQSIAANKALMDQRFADLDGTLTTKIGESKYADVLADPQFSNPFIQPLAQSLVGRLRERDPKITPDQIKQVLPSLIQHAMKQTPTNNQPTQNQQPPKNKTATEVNLDELFG